MNTSEPLPANWWQMPELTEVNRLPARATLYPFQNEEAAAGCDRTRSSYFQSLNGEWRFKLVTKPEATPSRFAALSYNDANWGRVAVPGNWNRQGYDRSIYTNMRMPWDENEPNVPDDNPTGL